MLKIGFKAIHISSGKKKVKALLLKDKEKQNKTRENKNKAYATHNQDAHEY